MILVFLYTIKIPQRSSFIDTNFSYYALLVSILTPLKCVLSVVVGPLDDPKHATPITRCGARPPDSFQWSSDGRYILVLKDIGGGEQSQLWVANLEKRTVINMTADPVVQTKIVKLSKRRPGEILVGMNIDRKSTRLNSSH